MKIVDIIETRQVVTYSNKKPVEYNNNKVLVTYGDYTNSLAEKKSFIKQLISAKNVNQLTTKTDIFYFQDKQDVEDLLKNLTYLDCYINLDNALNFMSIARGDCSNKIAVLNIYIPELNIQLPDLKKPGYEFDEIFNQIKTRKGYYITPTTALLAENILKEKQIQFTDNI